jgi:SAM-dependent methyltransferase
LAASCLAFRGYATPSRMNEGLPKDPGRVGGDHGVLRRLSEWLDSIPLTRSVRHGVWGIPGASSVIETVNARRLRRFERRGDARQRSKARWRSTSPHPDLTWGIELSGAPLVDSAESYDAFGPERTILEIGPGYGRLLRSCLERGVEFSRYFALDLSEQNVEWLQGNIRDERVTVLHGDAETVSLGTPLDTVLSFLTFKHFYPSFEEALRNLEGQLRPGGLMLFDLKEGPRQYFEWDQVTYVHEYTRREAEEIVNRSSLDLIAFDEVEHAPGRTRMVVVARKPA